jgi:hypothetical protein
LLDSRRLQVDEVERQQQATGRKLEEGLKALTEREAKAKTVESNLVRLREALEVRERWIKNKEAELAGLPPVDQQVQEAARKAVEVFQEEQRAGLQHITAWAGEVSTALVPLGMSPIRVPVPPATLSDALPVLDSAAERLRRLDPFIGARLEAEGRELARAVAEHVLVCFRSHFPDLSLGPITAGPVSSEEDAAREAVKDMVEVVASRFQREAADDAEPDLQ